LIFEYSFFTRKSASTILDSDRFYTNRENFEEKT
jgi:hypothetical protein